MAELRESKTSKVWRTILSFVLFILIVLSSLSACSKAVFLNKSSIEDMFTDYDYVIEVKNSAVEYANDIYLKNGLDSAQLDSIFDYDILRNSIKAYVSNNIGSGSEYNENTYLESIEQICASLEEDISNQINKNTLNKDEQSISRISESVKDYLVNEINICSAKIKTAINIASIASIVVFFVSLFFAVAAGLILLFVGSKRYRSIRAVGISFYTAGLFEFVISAMASVIFRIKKIDIFPLYLRDLLMEYIYTCIGSVVVTGFFLIVIAVAFSIITWRVRREK